MLKSPVVTTLDPAQLKRVADFMERVRTDPETIAQIEAERLKPFFDAFSSRLKEDYAALKDKPLIPPVVKKIITPKKLAEMFVKVAEVTQNVILSELMILPKGAANHRSLPGAKEVQIFEATKRYGYDDKTAQKFYFGFAQVFPLGKDTSSVSCPYIAFDPKMMDAVSAHGADTMFHAFQDVMSFGNHDMVHQFTNQYLNSQISRASTYRDMVARNTEAGIDKWWERHGLAGRDEDSRSYESWLMLNHQRVVLDQCTMESPLRARIDVFFDELARIGWAIAAEDPKHNREKSHEVVDYFNTMMGYALMRYLPFSHPLMEYALGRMQEADPYPELLMKKSAAVMKQADMMQQNGSFTNYFNKCIEIYNGRFTKNTMINMMPIDPNFVELKRLQLVMIEPWIARLMAPYSGDGEYDQVRRRTRHVTLDAMRTTLSCLRGTMPVGSYEFMVGDMTVSVQQGENKGDMIISERIADNDYANEHHYRHGKIVKTVRNDVNSVHGRHRCTTRLFKDGILDSADSPAVTVEDFLHNSIVSTWYKDGKIHRSGAPARSRADGSGIRSDEWLVEGQYFHPAGDAVFIETMEDGSIVKKWLKGEDWVATLHRLDGPAFIHQDSSGKIIEEAYFLNGLEFKKSEFLKRVNAQTPKPSHSKASFKLGN